MGVEPAELLPPNGHRLAPLAVAAVGLLRSLLLLPLRNLGSDSDRNAYPTLRAGAASDEPCDPASDAREGEASAVGLLAALSYPSSALGLPHDIVRAI